MTGIPPTDAKQDPSGGPPLGVFDALRMGWRLLMGDFWPIWLVAFVVMLLLMVSGCIPFGQFIAAPPLLAGFFLVLMRRIDGAAPSVGQLFEGFKQRFGQSIVSVLPVLIAWLVFGIIWMVVYFAAMLPIMIGAESNQGPEPQQVFAMVIPITLVLALVNILLALFQMFFIFALVAVWDLPHSGWAAAKTSMGMARDRFLSVLGFSVLVWIIYLVAVLVGAIACGIGTIFTIPVVMAWAGIAVVYLYRSWSGQPLEQPLAVESPPEGSGPVPPTSIEPPPPPPGL